MSRLDMGERRQALLIRQTPNKSLERTRER